MKTITVATAQMTCSWELDDNLHCAEKLIRQAAAQGAEVILIQELFETPYFCIEQNPAHYQLASSVEESEAIKQFRSLARELNVVLPCSWFEKANRAYFNSAAMIDCDGSILGVYRKSHIPNGPGYQEKNYFNPGDTGPLVWNTRFGQIGLGICWDQWFPEFARCLALKGAEIILYPSAIGSEPLPSPPVDSTMHWQRTMQGHAAANMIPVVASNRIGWETSTLDENLQINFYGHSFICDHTGEIVQQADASSETVIVQSFDLESIKRYRDGWGVFRDRRPDLYQAIQSHDGQA